jgi:hypothetical protein
MTTFDDKIGDVVERTRSIWGAVTLIGGFLVLFNCSWPWWIAYIVFSVCTYYGSLYAAGLACALLWDRGEIQAGLREKGRTALSAKMGEQVSDEERQKLLDDAGLQEAELVDFSTPPFGRYRDQDMFDWIELKADDVTTRFLYEQVAQLDAAGKPIIPDEEGYAHLNGILYKRAQPAQG